MAIKVSSALKVKVVVESDAPEYKELKAAIEAIEWNLTSVNGDESGQRIILDHYSH